ncbi:MAG: 50S ribosomal protein L10 [Spirochaetes bacterium]|nr:50S ribosomal protein L10 [Spirochaetota bacterium]
MVKQHKIDEVAKLKEQLRNKRNFILTHYSGIKVKDLSALRRKLREAGADYKVVKNKLFNLALRQEGYVSIENYLKGPTAVAFVKDDVSAVAKLLKEFKKEIEAFSIRLGVMDNAIYSAEQIEKIADLPPRDVVLAQLMGLINAPLTNIASGINQVIAALARGIKAVAEKRAQ